MTVPVLHDDKKSAYHNACLIKLYYSELIIMKRTIM